MADATMIARRSASRTILGTCLDRPNGARMVANPSPRFNPGFAVKNSLFRSIRAPQESLIRLAV